MGEMRSPSFDARLESLRGLAALGVAWTHGQMVFSVSGGPSYPTLGTIAGWVTRLLPAGAAVIVFFVLSSVATFAEHDVVLDFSIRVRHAAT